MALQKASSVEIRKSIEMSNHFAKNGILFIPIPVCGDGDQELAIKMLTDNLDKMAKMAESE